jgi:hypothetical protein
MQGGAIAIQDRRGLEQYCGGFYRVAEAQYAEIMGGVPDAAVRQSKEPVVSPSLEA